MDPRTRLSLLLFVLVIGLATFLIISEDNTQQATTPPLSSINAEDIGSIHIERQGKPAITLLKKKSRWRIQTPPALDANPDRVWAILQLLNAPSFAELNVDAVDLTQLRLDRPEVTLQLDGHIFSFGGTEPLQKHRYLRFLNSVHLVEDKLYPLLLQDTLFFASPKLVRDDMLINEITFPNFRLHRQESNWQVVPDGHVATERLLQLIKSWRETSAQQLMYYSPGRSLGSISIATEREQTIRFIIVEREPLLILARPDLGVTYHLDESDSKAIFHD